MRVKLKKCDGECDKETVIWKQFEGKRYCKECWMKLKPTLQPSSGSAPLKQRTPIPKQSPRRKKEDAVYSVMRAQWLKDHPNCFMAIPGICEQKATDIQHKKGRGKYYLDTRFWDSACRACHSYCDTHPEEAFEKGWAIPRLTNEE